MGTGLCLIPESGLCVGTERQRDEAGREWLNGSKSMKKMEAICRVKESSGWSIGEKEWLGERP